MAHAPFSPSKLAAIQACPGRPALVATLPPDEQEGPGSAAAVQGTKRHALLEWRFHNPTAPWPTEVGEYKITSDDVKAVEAIWPYVKSHAALQSKPGHTAFSEQEVEIGKWLGFAEKTCGGTADLVLVTPTELEIADAKFGYRPVGPDGLQLRAYAVGAPPLLVNPDTGEFLPQFRQLKTVRLTILQPEDSQAIKSVVYPFEDVIKWAEEVKQVIKAAQDPDAPRVPGDQCTFCPAAAVCPERIQEAGQAVTSMFSDLDAPAAKAPDVRPAAIESVDVIEDIANLQMTKDPKALGPEEIGRVLDLAPLIETYLSDVRKYAHKQISSGKPVPGWKLIEGRRSRRWNQSEEETAAALKKIGLAVGEVYVKKVVTPNQAEGLEKVSGSKKRRERVAELWSWAEGKPTLAPESDPHPDVREVKQMFNELPEANDAPAWL